MMRRVNVSGWFGFVVFWGVAVIGCVHTPHPDGNLDESWIEEPEYGMRVEPIQFSHFDPGYVFVADGETCPRDSRPLTLQEAAEYHDLICPQLGPWFIARLAGGGSMDGPGYNCNMRARDSRGLGHSICVSKPSTTHQCYWMENTSGHYAWVSTETIGLRVHNLETCFALDSCSGGLGRSGGGCYKWAEAAGEPGVFWQNGIPHTR